jgi:hypothetical protein
VATRQKPRKTRGLLIELELEKCRDPDDDDDDDDTDGCMAAWLHGYV